MIKSPAELTETINAFRISRIILSAYELDIFTLLHRASKRSSEVAAALKADPRATDRFLNALVSIGLLEKKEGIFSNTRLSSTCLVKGVPGYMAGISHQVHLWRTWGTLTEAVKAGTSVAVDRPIGKRDEEWLNSFITAMHSRGVPQAKEVADLLDFSNTHSILDVGGGSGAFAFEFIRRCNDARAVVFDLPEVVPITYKYISKEGFESSVMTKPGDYLADDFGTGYDLVIVSAVIHINSPDENELLIRKCSQSLNPGGQLVILDHIMNDDRTDPRAGALFAINMLVGTLHGDTYTEHEIKKWFNNAGIIRIERKNTISDTAVLIGIK